jgi:signal transduction histidine kinase
MARRRPGQSVATTSRQEADQVQILSGVYEGLTTGTPIAFVVYNKDHDPKAYDELRDLFRPGHADFTYQAKYGHRDHRGGGRSSGRETLARVTAGVIAKKILAEAGVRVISHTVQVGDVVAETFDEAEELLFESLEGVDRAAEIVRGVMGFAHAGPSTRESADVNDLLEDVLRMAAPQLRHGVTVARDFRDLRPVYCSPQELKQVFLNLVLNAGQAVENDGNIRIATDWVKDDVVVRVEDDGPGIDPKNLDRIFDPFFTTKNVGEGTGLGLGIAHQIIRAHGGAISVTSEPGARPTFTVRLPIAIENAETSSIAGVR